MTLAGAGSLGTAAAVSAGAAIYMESVAATTCLGMGPVGWAILGGVSAAALIGGAGAAYYKSQRNKKIKALSKTFKLQLIEAADVVIQQLSTLKTRSTNVEGQIHEMEHLKW